MVESAAVPTWSGDPSEFESFVIACRWFEKSLKPSERTQAAPKIWARLTGPAKAVVKHLDPDEFASDEGLQRLLTVLRTSPLQQLPVPDSFKRLDVWHHLKRGQQESIPELLVREEDLFVQLQQALKRARQDRNLLSHADLVRDPVARPPPSTPSQSPINLTGSRYADRIPPDTPQEARDRAPGGDASTSVVGDFFEDELRGYRLLKAARLSTAERQNVLTQTGNSTAFHMIRRALRTLFATEEDAEQSRGWTRKQQVWWNEDAGYDQSHEDHWIEEWPYDDWYGDPGHDEEAYWHAWPGHDEEWMEDSPWSEWPPDELPVAEGDEDPLEQQYAEAYTLANEAQKTLAEARDAVRRVRQARGYYAPESMTGKGKTKSPASSPSSGGKSSFSGKSGWGPCFICGKPNHSYRQCPDRFAKGRSTSHKGSGKGFGKGFKGKSKKGKGFGKPIQFHSLTVPLFPLHVYFKEQVQGCRVIIDTGASENAVGSTALQHMLEASGLDHEVTTADRPVFRFGNGLQAQAKSRVDLKGTSLGSISFYVLGNEAHQTPPLMGGKTLRELKAMLAYERNLFLYQAPHEETWSAVQMAPHASSHVSIDLLEKAVATDLSVFGMSSANQSVVERVSLPPTVLMMSTSCLSMPSTADSTSTLARRLEDLRTRIARHGQGQAAMRCGRSKSSQQLPLLWGTQAQDEAEPVRQLDDMSGVRPADQLCEQEGLRGRLEAHGPAPALDQCSSGATPSDHAGKSGEREDRERQGHGAQGHPVAAGPHEHPGHQYDLPGVLQEDGHLDEVKPNLSGKGEEPGISGSKGQDPSDGSGTSNSPDGAPEDGSSQVPGILGPRGDQRVCDGPEVQGRDLGVPKEHQEGAQGGCGVGSHLDRIIGGGAGGGEECTRSRIGQLWCSLRSLRERAASVMKTGHDIMCTTCTTNTTNASAPLGTTRHGSPKEHIDCAIQFESGISPGGGDENEAARDLPLPGPGGGKRAGVAPSTARKLATNMAVIGALITAPMHGLFGMMSDQADFCEVACAPTSSLSECMASMGYNIQRINYKEGFDLEKKEGTMKFGELMSSKPPRQHG